MPIWRAEVLQAIDPLPGIIGPPLIVDRRHQNIVLDAIVVPQFEVLLC